MTMVIHLCPVGDSNIMPCCSKTPFEAPLSDLMTLDPKLVTCKGKTEGVKISTAPGWCNEHGSYETNAERMICPDCELAALREVVKAADEFFDVADSAVEYTDALYNAARSRFRAARAKVALPWRLSRRAPDGCRYDP